MSGQSGGYRLHLSTLNEQLTCKLCGGYFIDATTIIECLHSFCRSCIIKYLESNKYCPICEVQVHKSKPLLNIRPDHTLQDIVYKLVPGCYQNEMRCRREFYSKYPDARTQASSPESRGEPIESHIYSLDEALSLSLEYYMPNSKEQTESEKESTAKPLPRRYLRCPAAVTVFHLQKLIRAKYGLSDAHRVDIMYKEEPLCGNYTLMDVMYIYHWRRKVPLHLSYRIFESSPKRLKLSEDNHVYEKILSNTKVDTVQLKSDPSEKREWKEVQLKISETGVMSVTDISSFESKKNVSNGDGNSEELITLDKSTVRLERLEEKTVRVDKNETASLEDPKGKENSDKSKVEETQKIPVVNTEILKITKNTLQGQESKKCIINADENTSAGGSESQKLNPVDVSSKAITKQETEVKSLTSDTQKSNNNQSKGKNNSSQDSSHVKNLPESSVQGTKKGESRTVNTNNNLINTEAKADSQKENSKAVVKEMKNAGTSVETRQNALSSMPPFQPKVGQVNNTYSKKIPKEKKPILMNSRKLEGKTGPDQQKPDSKPSAHFASTKSQVTATVSSTKLATTVVSSPHSTTMSTQTVNTFVTVPQGSCLFVSSPQQVTSCVLSNSTMVSSIQNPPLASNKALAMSSQNLESPVAKPTDQKTSSTGAAKSDSGNQKASSMVKNNNNNPTSSSHSLASIGMNVSTVIPTSVETNSNVSHAVQNLVSSPNAKNVDSKTDNNGQKLNTSSEKLSVNVTDMQTGTQSLSIYSVTTPSISNPRLSSPQTSSAQKRSNSQLGIEISNVYTVPPCPDAIPISLMKPTVRKHEIIAKGTNLNEICAKIGESSKEKIKAATRSKPEIPDLLKIPRKIVPETVKSIPNMPPNANVPTVYVSVNTANQVDEKPIISVSKEATKTIAPISSSQTLPTPITTQKSCPVKKQSQPVGYKTLRDPPKSWNPTLSKNNYVAARNQAKEMQNQSQSASVSDGGTVKPIVSKPAKIFKMRNMPRYLGNPASGVKPMYGVTNESKDKDKLTQSVAKGSPLGMMTIDPKTLSPIVSGTNSPMISPPPYSPNARNYQGTHLSREICRNPGSPISPRNSPINMLATNPFIPSPTLNTNPKLMFPPFLPPYPDTSRFPNPLIRSPVGIPSPSAFHNSLPPSINKYQRGSYLPPVTGYTTTPTPPTIQKILPSIHSSPKSPKSTSVNTGPMFSIGKTEVQLPTRVENIALHLAKNAAQQERSVFNLSKTGSGSSNQASTNFQNLLTTTTITLSTSGYTATEASPNVTTQTTARSKPQLEIKIPEPEGFKQKSKEPPETVDLESGDEPVATKSKPEGNADSKEKKEVSDKKENTTTGTTITTTMATKTTTTTATSTITSKKINGEVTVQNTSPSRKDITDKDNAFKITDNTTSTTTSVSNSNNGKEQPSSKDADFKSFDKSSLEVNNDKLLTTDTTKSDDGIRKTCEQIQVKKTDVQRNKPES